MTAETQNIIDQLREADGAFEMFRGYGGPPLKLQNILLRAMGRLNTLDRQVQECRQKEHKEQ